MLDFRVIVQARMSSSRFPGKVLAPLGGQPLIAHVLSRVCEVVQKDRVTLVTSEHVTDDPLVSYVDGVLGVRVFRGSLDNVLERFQLCLQAHPCKWFVRICGDSPVIDPGLLCWMLERVSKDIDLLTNVAKRTFPPGESIEIVRTNTFLGLKPDELTPEEREHVTLYFYNHLERYKISNVSSQSESISHRRLVVDTLEDLRSLEHILAKDSGQTRGYAANARLDRYLV